MAMMALRIDGPSTAVIDDRQQHHREGLQALDQARQRVIDPAPEVARDQPDQNPADHGDADGDDPDLDGDSRPEEEPAEQIAAELIGARGDRCGSVPAAGPACAAGPGCTGPAPERTARRGG